MASNNNNNTNMPTQSNESRPPPPNRGNRGPTSGRGQGGGGEGNGNSNSVRGSGGNNRNRNRNRNRNKNEDKNNANATTNATSNARDQQRQQSQKQEQGNNKGNASSTQSSLSSGQVKKRTRNRNRKKNTVTTNTDANPNNELLTQESQPTPQLTEEEKQQLEFQKLQEAKRQALENEHLLQQKREQEYKQNKQNLETNIQTTIQNITQNILLPTNAHTSNRHLHSKDTLSTLRSNFLSSKKSLKSDLKKCTAFCKKIKSTVHWNDQNVITSMIKDVETLNLTRYIEEIANAFLECKIKVGDVGGVVEICFALHQRYSDFMNLLTPRLLASFTKKSGSTGGEDLKQKRLHLRLLLELYVNGVLLEVKPLMKIIVEATGANSTTISSGTNADDNHDDNDNSHTYNVTDANLVVAFAKAAGHEVVGVVPKSIVRDIEFLQTEIEKAKNWNESRIMNNNNDISQCGDEITTTTATAADATSNIQQNDDSTMIVGANLEESHNFDEPIIASSDLLTQASNVIESVKIALLNRAFSDDVCYRFHMHLLGAYKCLCSSYVITHKKLVKLEKRCEEDRLLAGALSEQREKGLIDARKLMENLDKCVNALAETLNEDVPLLEADDDEEAKEDKIGVEVYKIQDGKESNLGPFDDEETMLFYCDIPDLLTTIPPALLGYSPDDIEKKKEANIQKYGSMTEVTSEDHGDFSESDANQDFDDCEMENVASADIEVDKEDNVENKDTPHYKLMVLLEQELPECNRIDKVNELAEKFCTNYGTSKASRKKIQQSLFSIPRSRLDLIPYYSRLAAIFDRVFPDIAAPLVKELEKQFHGLVRFKKQQNLENRLRNARYIGELTKFRVAPPIIVLRGIRRCLDDFSGYNVDVACCLLEACGRYLHRTKHTSGKLSQLMDTMKRLRKAKNLDERQLALLNSAFYIVQPPQTSSKRGGKVLSTLEAYMKDLLLFRLGTNEISTTAVSKQLVRYPWSDASLDCGALVTKYLLKACRKGRYKSISKVVKLISILKKSKPEVLTRVVDAVLEDLQYAMETPNIRDQQRSIIYAKLLGELHCESLVSGSMIFEQLYNFVNFDHEIPEALISKTADEDSCMKDTLVGSLAITEAINEDEEMDNDELQTQKTEVQQPVGVSKVSKFDPRVPSLLDPETSVFRIKLICTLLDSSCASLITSSTIPKLEKFLAALQRYLFIKSNLPADIEFSILDTFDIIDSKMKSLKNDKKKQLSSMRYKTWLESHNAVVAAEELDATSEQRSKRRLLAQAGLKSEKELVDDLYDLAENDISVHSSENESRDNGSLRSSDDESEASLDVDSFDGESEVRIDEIDDESKDDEDDEVATFDNEENDEADTQDAYMQKLEDEAFERELRKLTLDALEKGKNIARTLTGAKVSDTMPSASQFVGKKEFMHNRLPSSNTPFAIGGEAGMAFKLIKRGHKGRVESKDIVVPTDTNLAKVATKQDNEAAKERDILKARVLQYEAESANSPFGGDIYMDQSRISENRNRQVLTMEDIDRNFGPSSSSNNRGRNTRASGRTLWRSR